MEFSKIELNNRERISKIRNLAGYTLLSHSFDTLFLWQDTMQLSIWLEEDFFVVRYGLAGENSYFCPCGNENKMKRFIDDFCQTDGFQLFYMDETRKNWLMAYAPELFSFSYDRGSCEYIYDRNQHLLKQGKTYQRIRRELNHLESQYRLHTEILSRDNLSLSRAVIHEWQLQNDHEPTGLITNDHQMVENALAWFEPLGMKGVLIYMNDRPVATAIGGEICGDTYGIQVAKMCERTGGLMFYLLDRMFEVIPGQYRYVNGDDDMNIEGIRIHKIKMKPVRMNEVWKAVRREKS